MSNCPNCGAALPAPDHKGTLRCSYCGSLIEVGAIEWCPDKNIPEHELLKELKKLKVAVTEPVYIDLFFDNKSIDKYIAADYGHAVDATRYMIGEVSNDKKRTM